MNADSTAWLTFWLNYTQRLVAGGSNGNPKAPLRFDGRNGGRFTEDYHGRVETVPSNALSYGVAFDPTSRLIMLDTDGKNYVDLGDGSGPRAHALAREIRAALGESYREQSSTTGAGGEHDLYLLPADFDYDAQTSGRLSVEHADGTNNDLFLSTGWARTMPSPGIVPVDAIAPRELTSTQAQWLVDQFAHEDSVPTPTKRAAVKTSAANPFGGSSSGIFDVTYEELERQGGVLGACLRHGWTDLGRNRLRRPGWSQGHAEGTNGHSASINASGRLICWSTTTGLPGVASRTTYDALDIEAHYQRRSREDVARGYWDARPRTERYETREPVDFSVMAAQADNAEWPDIISLEDEPLILPAFPVTALPAFAQARILDIAADFQGPPDLAAMFGLGAISTAVHGRVRVTVGGNWREFGNIFQCIAADSSTGKSPVAAMMNEPLDAFEKRQEAQFKESDLIAQSKKRMLTAELGRHEVKNDAEAVAKTIHELELLHAASPISSRRMTIKNATPAALEDALGETGGRMAIVDPDGDLLEAFGAGKEPDLATYNAGFSNEPIRTRRVARGQVTLPRTSLVITTSVQSVDDLNNPRLLKRGFTPRFMVSQVPPGPGPRDRRKAHTVNLAAKRAYEEGLAHVLGRMALFDGVADYVFSDDARTLWGTWTQRTEDISWGYPAGHHMKKFIGKLESTVARVALILHVVDNIDASPRVVDVGAESLEKAVLIGEYWLAHAAAIYGRWADDEAIGDARVSGDLALARKLVEVIHRRELSEFATRDALRWARSLGTAERTERIISILIDRGYVRPFGVNRSGKPRFEVNRGLFGPKRLELSPTVTPPKMTP
jgi:replicative DNA helicase